MIRRKLHGGEIAYFDPTVKRLIVVDSNADAPVEASSQDLEKLVAAGSAKEYDEAALRVVSQALSAIALLGGPD